MTAIENPNYNTFNYIQNPNYNNSFNNINNFITMQNMFQNNMNNMNNSNFFNNMKMIPSFSYPNQMNFTNNSSFMPNPMQYSFPMNNSMINTMKDIKLNNYMNSMNNMNNINNTMNFNTNYKTNNNIINSMNNIQPSYCMNESNNNISINNTNQSMMNNMLNSVNININNNNSTNFPNFPINNFNMMNNYFSDNLYNYNPINLSNSFNNIFLPKNSDDFPLGQSINQLNLCNTSKFFSNDITIDFAFTNTTTYKVSGKPNEKLSQIYDRFKGFHPEIKGKIQYCLHTGLVLNMEKTLKELNINNGDRILFILEEKNVNEKKNKEKVNIDLNTLNKYKQIGIMIKEHIHNLVYCLNNFTWKCNLCKFKYEKQFPKYFCSLCNYSMCEKCHDIRNYQKFKAFPENSDNSKIDIKKKFLKTVYHKHILVYSRTSRDPTELKQWYCDNCKENFENDVWSFYCTKCDYDLCKKCAGFT
jgi:hypothetical protein